VTAEQTRREFLKRSGALVVCFGASAFELHALAQGRGGAPGGQRPQVDARLLDSWIGVAADGSVTAHTGKCELGQGMQTAQAQLIAEELSVAVDRVTLIMCDTSICPDQGTTSGSQSHPANFNHANLALACATAREALVGLAAARFAVPRDQVVVQRGVASVRTDRSKTVTYGELIGGRAFTIPLDPNAKRKDPRTWTVLGTTAPRVDLPAMVAGQLEYVQNVRVPGMLHGAVVRPPEVGATLTSVDERSVQGLPGVIKVVVRKNFAGVVAEKPWQAIRAAAALKAEWSAGSGLPRQADFYDYLRKQPSRDTLVVDSRDVDENSARAAAIVKATYRHPYQMHGSMGSSCAVADVQADRVTIWSSTQSAYPTRSGIATLLGVPAERVRVVFTRGSGCYGINGADTVAYDAALLSHAVARPVRVQLSRKDEMAWENYGFAYVIDERVALDGAGNITAWDHESWAPSLGGRPGYDTPGNVVTGMLAGFQPAAFTPRSPAPAPAGRFNNGSNAAPSYVTGCVAGACGGTGSVKSERVLTHTVRSPFFTGPLRSPSRLQNTFAHESFIDEIAARVKADPVEYRLRHLRDPRLVDVVKAAAKAAAWETRPSPRAPQGAQRARASGRGMACVLYEGDNGYCALVAEVEVDGNSGSIAVKRLVAAQDCGPISSPDGMKNQIEGGLLQGMSRALGEEVTWDDRKVTSVDWRTYRSLTLGANVPAIETVLINRPDSEAMGAGETAITLVAAAIGNAVFDATGARLREVPFTPERVKAALAEKI
jgi:nicotinate dehydrogenase subunit B